ncbi:hypothetical protein BX070DRAFT_225295 [Coemansia spiralis]|nr:hypothetical protein BX070DRAFT_225295 [Coemansia spiralis]
MNELVQGVKLKFELPFKIPTPVSFPFESIGTFRPITRIPKYDYSLEKKIMKEIVKQKQEDEYNQLKQAQQQLSMVDLIASRKNRHKGKEPERNSVQLSKPNSESGVSRLQKSEQLEKQTNSSLPVSSSSTANINSTPKDDVAGEQATGLSDTALSAATTATSPSTFAQAPTNLQPPSIQPGPQAMSARPQSAGATVTNTHQSPKSQPRPQPQQMTAVPQTTAAVAPTAQTSHVGGVASTYSQAHAVPTNGAMSLPITPTSNGSGFVANSQHIQRPIMQMQYPASSQLRPQSRPLHQQQAAIFGPTQQPAGGPMGYTIPTSASQQPAMQPLSSTVPTSARPSPMYPNITGMPQTQQHANMPSPDLRYSNHYSASFGAQSSFAGTSASSNTSTPALPPKPEEWKPHKSNAVSPNLPLSSAAMAVEPHLPSVGIGQAQSSSPGRYQQSLPPTLPNRHQNNQDQQPPAIPPKPFASFSEFDYASDGPGGLGTAENPGDHVEQLNTLLSMGFSRPHAIHALEMYDYDVNKASNYLIDKSQ